MCVHGQGSIYMSIGTLAADSATTAKLLRLRRRFYPPPPPAVRRLRLLHLCGRNAKFTPLRCQGGKLNGGAVAARAPLLQRPTRKCLR